MKPTYGQLLVNLAAARHAVCLLRSMVSCGEQHSDDSRAAIKLALEGMTFDKLTEKSIEQEVEVMHKIEIRRKEGVPERR